MSEVTRLLDAVERGEPHAAEELLPFVYEELRRLARQRMASQPPGQTLQATALVHEAYLRLVGDQPASPWNSRGHFFAAAAEAMRRILVESTRRKQALKRGAGAARVDLEDGDGDLDLYVPAYGRKPNHLLRNDGDGVFRVMNQREQSRDAGALSTNDTDTPMGVWADMANVVRIEWPSGIVQELANVPADQILTVVEPVRLNVVAPDGLSWHSSKAREFTLESAPTVNGPWAPATETVMSDGNLRTATLQTDGGARFYRLQNTPPAR